MRLLPYCVEVLALVVSIHAPRTGCDWIEALQRKREEVSIHAPRTGCDQAHPVGGPLPHRFNSRTPHGVRRGATANKWHPQHVSIHAPRTGCDAFSRRTSRMQPPFQFTHPARGATIYLSLASISRAFQFTHPARGATGAVAHEC